MNVVHRTAFEMAAIRQNLFRYLFTNNVVREIHPVPGFSSVEESSGPSQSERIANQMVPAHIPLNAFREKIRLLPQALQESRFQIAPRLETLRPDPAITANPPADSRSHGKSVPSQGRPG